ncbi:hypothetical protein [Arthrobacter sp. 179]|uniref:hypothetical protein n=1 Tax=Arthrobacter sp. 179 TaxID=3457734 RepID=UPI004034746A
MEHPTGTRDPWQQPGPPADLSEPVRLGPSIGKPWAFGIIGLVIGVAIGAIVGQLSTGTPAVPVESQSAASTQLITDAVADCDVEDSLGVDVMDEGASLQLSTTGEESSGASYIEVICVLQKLDVPESVVARFGTTRALDGQQTADWDGFTASWGYHPDTGLDIVVEPQPQD